MTLLLIYAVLSIVFSFLCSIWEAVLLKIPASFIEIKTAEGNPIGPMLKGMTDQIDRPLSAILSLNTLAHTVGAMMVGGQAQVLYGDEGSDLQGLELLLSGEFIVASLMTLAILVLSEIIPKTIGATYWRKLANFTARSLKIVMFLMYPFIVLLELITKSLKGPGHGETVSREDFSAMAQIGQRAGVFNPGESKIISNLMRFHLIQAKSIMTPRTVVKAADETITIQAFYDENPKLSFSRIPVYQETRDHITGFVLKDVILEHLLKNKGDLPLSKISRTISFVKEKDNIQDVFNHFLEKKEQIALVVDDFGGMAGIVSMEDVIETLLGLEIVDEMDDTVDMQTLARQNWEKRAEKLGLMQEDDDEES